jgi:cytochrome c551/c552
MRPLLTFLGLVLSTTIMNAAPPGAAFLAKHCTSCHNADLSESRLNLETLPEKFEDPATSAKWVRVVDRVRNGEMPPAKKPRPDAKELDAAMKEVALKILQGEQARRTREGRSAIRRLNHTEFENTLRDLFDLPALEVRELLPSDGRVDGYSKSAAALDVSPILLARYEEAIDKALEMATAKWAVPPEATLQTMYANQEYDFQILLSGGDAVMLKDKKYDESRFPMPAGDDKIPYPNGKWQFGGKYKDHGEAHKSGMFKEPATVGTVRTIGEAFAARFGYAPIHPGRYRIGITAWSYWWDKGEVKPFPRDGSVGVYLGSRVLGFFPARSLAPTHSEVTVDYEPKQGGLLRAIGASFMDKHVYFHKGQISAVQAPGVAIDSITIEGPLHEEWPPASHRQMFGHLPVVPFSKLPASALRPKRVMPQQHNPHARNGATRIVPGVTVSENPPGDARKLLGAFLPKAFRRSVSWEEIERYAGHVTQRMQEGACFEDAMIAAYKRALISPDFLFLMEPVGELTPMTIANRLSYFLWNSMPDDTLFALAKSGALRDPKTLRTEAIRLLDDSKAKRFHQDFLDQWLELRDFDATSPDKRLYPEFQPYLEDAIRREPAEFFGLALKRNLTTSELFVTGIHTVNQRLAEHYSLQETRGTEFRQVDVDPSIVPHGGFLTMAAVMKVTANGTTTSPVKRGAWVMKHILGQTPETPPPNISAIEPDVRGATTVRELLAKHRDNPSCAGCHAKFDPVGFALESFDPIGGMREFYRATETKKPANPEKLFRAYLGPDGKYSGPIGFYNGPDVDASGKLEGAASFANTLEFRKLIAAQPRRLSRNFLNQLIHYSTGASVGFADRDAVEAMLPTGRENPRVRDLILDLIQSPIFLSK